MNCWKCQAAMRSAEARYCPNCGASASGPPGADAQAWGGRLASDAGGQAIPRFVAKIGVVVAGFMGWLAFPFFFARYSTRLAAAAGFVFSDRLARARFEGTPEGRLVLARLQRAARPPMLRGWVAGGALGAALLLPWMIVFVIAPAAAPPQVRYARVVSSVLDGRSAGAYVWVADKEDFQTQMRAMRDHFDYASVSYLPTAREPGASSSLRSARWASDLPGSWYERPFEYIDSSGRPPTVQRASSITGYWRGTEAFTIAFIVSLVFCGLTFGAAHAWFWWRFTVLRSRLATAAAFARGDLRFHDELTAELKSADRQLWLIVGPLSLLPLHAAAFPFSAPYMIGRLTRWSQGRGIERSITL